MNSSSSRGKRITIIDQLVAAVRTAEESKRTAQDRTSPQLICPMITQVTVLVWRTQGEPNTLGIGRKITSFDFSTRSMSEKQAEGMYL